MKNPVCIHSGDLLMNAQTGDIFRARWATRAGRGVELTGRFNHSAVQTQLLIPKKELYRWVVQKANTDLWLDLEKFL